jgi:hypothetical protein
MARIESPGGAGDSEPVKKLDGDNRKGNGVAFVLAVYAASRLLYLISDPCSPGSCRLPASSGRPWTCLSGA